MADLQSHPFILYKEGSLFEEIINGYFRETNLRPRVVMRLDNAEAIKAMVRSGLGLAMLPLWTLKGEIENKELKLVRQQEAPLYAHIALMTRNLSYQPPAVRAFTKIARIWNWKNARLTR